MLHKKVNKFLPNYSKKTDSGSKARVSVKEQLDKSQKRKTVKSPVTLSRTSNSPSLAEKLEKMVYEDSLETIESKESIQLLIPHKDEEGSNREKTKA